MSSQLFILAVVAEPEALGALLGPASEGRGREDLGTLGS